MPLFDIDNPLCADATALYQTGQYLAECSAAWSLAEASGTDEEKKAATLQRVIIGPHAGPWDDDEFTVDELAARFIEFQIYAPLEGGKTLISDALDTDEGGEIYLTTRRYCRPAELVDRQDLYLFFVDRMAALEHQLLQWFENGRNQPRLYSVTRRQGPAFGEKKSETAQGEYLFMHHTIGWGDNLGSDNS